MTQPQPQIACARCGAQPLTRTPRNFKFHLTHSPNADSLRGFGQGNPQYGLHREHIIQSDKWQWEYLCIPCWEKCDQLEVTAPAAPQEWTVYLYQIPSSSDLSVNYKVEIRYEVNSGEIIVFCQCAWAIHKSNADQGKEVKFCSHQRRAIERHLELFPPPQQTPDVSDARSTP